MTPRYIKIVMSILIMLSVMNPVYAAYAPTYLESLVWKADLIIIGTINNLDTETFDLDIFEIVYGDWKDNKIKVNQFRDWTCAGRWTDYRLGQKVFLFLANDTWNASHKETSWDIIGAADEGELPIERNNVYFDGVIGAGKMPITREKYAVWGDTFYGYKFDLFTMKDAVKNVRGCYQITLKDNKYRQISTVKSICSDTALHHLKGISFFHEFLIEKLESFRKRK